MKCELNFMYHLIRLIALLTIKISKGKMVDVDADGHVDLPILNFGSYNIFQVFLLFELLYTFHRNWFFFMCFILFLLNTKAIDVIPNLKCLRDLGQQ